MIRFQESMSSSSPEASLEASRRPVTRLLGSPGEQIINPASDFYDSMKVKYQRFTLLGNSFPNKVMASAMKGSLRQGTVSTHEIKAGTMQLSLRPSKPMAQLRPASLTNFDHLCHDVDEPITEFTCFPKLPPEIRDKIVSHRCPFPMFTMLCLTQASL